MHRTSGFSLLEAAICITILALLAATLIPLASSLINTQRANAESDELQAAYKAIVGDPNAKTLGYLGDVGDYPSSLLDLVQSPGLTGWNGPYMNAARIDSGIVYDPFGGAIEYYQPTPAACSSGTCPSVLDQLALISRGPDRSSTNNASNPNQRSAFAGTLPSSAGYSSGSGNLDNVVYPNFIDNSSVLNYVSLGQVNFNIYDFDEAAAVNTNVPGCPGLYDIVITSIPRGTNEAWMTYNSGAAIPGAASVYLLQGLYTVQVLVSGSRYPILQEEISVTPGTILTRDYTIPGVNSSLSAPVSLTIKDLFATSSLNLYVDGVGPVVVPAGGTVTDTTHFFRCALIENRWGVNVDYDRFIVPTIPMTKTYSSTAPTKYTLTVQNGTYNTLAVYDAGLLVGTVTKRSNQRAQTFSVPSGDTITVKDANNNTVSPNGTFTVSANTTKTY